MASSDELLVRVYDVKFGDFVYVRVPDGEGDFHMLIDCGTEKSGDPKKNPDFKAAFDHMRSELPQEDGEHRLDLLVVTHPHEDHIKGFDPKWFKGIRIKRIWLSAFMYKNHPQASQALALQDLAERAAKQLLERSHLNLSPGLRWLLLKSIGNAGAMDALRTGLAQKSGIHPQYPLYVARDIADPLQELAPSGLDPEEYGLGFADGTTYLGDFAEKTTRLRILAPEWNIDGWYLGEDLPSVKGLQSLVNLYTPGGRQPLKTPDNISESDFRQLRSRMFYSALAFSQEDDDLKNNVSVVLLLEWRGRRLLFTGDAEWKGGEVKEGRDNPCWDVMLHVPEVSKALLQPLDFLKVGHHGSLNGTPFVKPKNRQQRVEQPTLDKMLPEDAADDSKAYIVVSTDTGEHGEKNEVPYAPLLWELGCRARNAQKYAEEGDKYGFLSGKGQPLRTDREALKPGAEVPHRVDISLPAAPGWNP